MLEAESSSSDSSLDADSSSEIFSSDSDSESDSSDDSRDRRSYRRSSTPPVNTDGIPPGADEMTVGRHLHRPITVVTRHGVDAMTAGRHLHLALAETTVEVVMGVIVAGHHPPPGGIVGTATRSQGHHLVRVRVLRHAERAHETGTVLVIMTAEGMIHGTNTGIAGVDEDVYPLGISTLRVLVVPFCLLSSPVLMKVLTYPTFERSFNCVI